MIRRLGRGGDWQHGHLHVQHTATLLPNGKVLVAAGGDGLGGILSSAELYDPATGSWTAHRQPRHRTLRSHGDATALRQGAGGGGSNLDIDTLSSAELYDPATGIVDGDRQHGHRTHI